MHSKSIDYIATTTSIRFSYDDNATYELKKRIFTHYYDFDTIFFEKKNKKIENMIKVSKNY